MARQAPSRPPRRGKMESLEEDCQLLVFGYSCRLYPNDDKAEYIAEERHLCNWNDSSVLIDSQQVVKRIEFNFKVSITTHLDKASPPTVLLVLLYCYHSMMVNSFRAKSFDCRQLLDSIDDIAIVAGPSLPDDDCPNDAMEEEMCADERYKDLYLDIQQKAIVEEETKRKRAEIAFSYDDGANDNGREEEEESDSEHEPFETPEGVKLPVGLECPPNQKLNHIILRTASFVVEKGPQMEIVIKAKQRQNSDQFGFLEFDHLLNPYYKYMMKMIREKKYNLSDMTKRKKKKVKKASVNGNSKHKSLGALAAIVSAASDSDSDSESDCELHPSLLARRRSATPDPLETRSGIGPRKKPLSPPPRPAEAPKLDYKIDKANDMYASLFKSLSAVTDEQREREHQAEQRQHVTEGAEDVDFQHWWEWFYSSKCPYSSPSPLIPPPPDLMPVIESYAEYTATHGAHGEQLLIDRAEKEKMAMNFLVNTSPHYSYYQNKVRLYQWQLGYYPPHTEQTVLGTTEGHGSASASPCSFSNAPPPPPTVVVDTSVPPPTIHPVASAPVLSNLSTVVTTEAPPPPLNRKQRRRLQDAPKANPGSSPPPPSLMDPIAMTAIEEASAPIPKSVSSPQISLQLVPDYSHDDSDVDSDGDGGSASPDVEDSTAALLMEEANEHGADSPAGSSSPVSFSLQVKKSVPPTPSSTDTHPVTVVPSSLSAPSSLASVPPLSVPPMVPAPPVLQPSFIPPAPEPPSIQNDLQLERKEKARIFMERLLNEKRIAKKKKEEEEERERELQQQKLVKDMDHEDGEISTPPRKDKKEKKKKRHRSRSRSPTSHREEKGNTVDLIDKLINSKINSLLETTTGIKIDETPNKENAGSDDEHGKKHKKKKRKEEKKKDRKRDRSRSRSASSDDRRNKKRRNRSRSPARSSRHR